MHANYRSQSPQIGQQGLKHAARCQAKTSVHKPRKPSGQQAHKATLAPKMPACPVHVHAAVDGSALPMQLHMHLVYYCFIRVPAESYGASAEERWPHNILKRIGKPIAPESTTTSTGTPATTQSSTKVTTPGNIKAQDDKKMQGNQQHAASTSSKACAATPVSSSSASTAESSAPKAAATEPLSLSSSPSPSTTATAVPAVAAAPKATTVPAAIPTPAPAAAAAVPSTAGAAPPALRQEGPGCPYNEYAYSDAELRATVQANFSPKLRQPSLLQPAPLISVPSMMSPFCDVLIAQDLSTTSSRTSNASTNSGGNTNSSGGSGTSCGGSGSTSSGGSNPTSNTEEGFLAGLRSYVKKVFFWRASPKAAPSSLIATPAIALKSLKPVGPCSTISTCRIVQVFDSYSTSAAISTSSSRRRQPWELTWDPAAAAAVESPAATPTSPSTGTVSCRQVSTLQGKAAAVVRRTSNDCRVSHDSA